MHARSKTLKCSYNMHLCLPYLLNDSQTIHSTIHFSKPLLCVTLICGDWFRWLVIIWCTAVTRETAIFNAPKRHPVGEDEFAFSFRPTQRSIFPRWMSNMLMFNVDVNMKRLGIRLKKNDKFQWFRDDCFFWETFTLYAVHFEIKTLAGCMKGYF